MRKHLLSLRGISFIRLAIIAFCVSLVISYVSLHKLIFVSNNTMFNGEKMHTFAQRTRTDLIKRLGAKPFVCKTQDNVSINGLLIKRENAKATILLCHGYRCCKELTSGYVDLFPEFNTVLFDFRAHGENKRTITTVGCHEHKDILAVEKWLRKNEPSLYEIPFIVLGISMGGAVALRAVHHNPNLCDGLIIDSSFSNLKAVLYNTFVRKSGLPTFPFYTMMEKMLNYFGACDVDAMRPLEAVKQLKKPLFLIHSCVDEVVPVQESLLMYAQGAKTGAKLWIAPECKHGWLHKHYPKLYKKKIDRFLKKRVNL